MRETLFNWLGQDLSGLDCLDLFAGSGALGFEAASRNARRVVMIEKARPVYLALDSNRKTIGIERVDLLQADALAWLGRTADQFDIVFLDPPFATDLLAQVLAQLAPRLKPNAVVYAECAAWPDLAGWTLSKELKAGAVRCGLLQRADSTSGDAI
ncbi:hypothetical protein JCM19000A_30710 [Silvimonas sp. JCM 19000]